MAIIETKPAAFKGVEFLMKVATTSGGVKDMLFEFPNSNKQTVEQFGLKVRTYNITAIIPHDGYYEKLNSLLLTIEEGGKGPLDHPTFGKIEDVVARTFVLNESISDLGRAELQITFTVSDDIGTPQEALGSISEANQSNLAVTDVLNASVADDFEVDTGFFGNFQDAQSILSDIGDAFNAAINTVTAITTEINQFAAQINGYVDDINKLIALPQDLANSIKNLFSTVNGMFSAFESTTSVYRELFDFGDNDKVNGKLVTTDLTVTAETTAGLTQRTKNRDVLNQLIQVSSLGYAYLNAVQIEFKTTDDIDDINTLLETQYEKIIDNEKFTEEAKRAITDARTVANKLFDNKRLDAKKIIEIDTHLRPISEIAYEYYGDTKLTDTLIELNNISNASFVEGTIKILTE